jgi:hypothetical protein
MNEKTLRLLDKVTDKLATKIADRLVDKLGIRLADTIAQRLVYHQRMSTLTQEQRDEQYADEALRAAGYVPGPDGWVAGEALAAKQRQRAERREQRRRESGYYDEARGREWEEIAAEAKRLRAAKRAAKK